MFELELLRHGAKNNDPRSHGSGYDAALDPTRIPEIAEAAKQRFAGGDGGGLIRVSSTPAPRACATARHFVEALWALRLGDRLCGPEEADYLGSLVRGTDGEIINLSGPTMSALWAQQKSQKSPIADAETPSLRAWCSISFDAKPSEGITLRENACRVARFVVDAARYADREKRLRHHIAFGHSGDLEPFLLLMLATYRNLDAAEPQIILELLEETGGALRPLYGYRLAFEKDCCKLTYGTGAIRFPRALLQQHAAWLDAYGSAEHVVKLRG